MRVLKWPSISLFTVAVAVLVAGFVVLTCLPEEDLEVLIGTERGISRVHSSDSSLDSSLLSVLGGDLLKETIDAFVDTCGLGIGLFSLVAPVRVTDSLDDPAVSIRRVEQNTLSIIGQSRPAVLPGLCPKARKRLGRCWVTASMPPSKASAMPLKVSGRSSGTDARL